MSGHSKWHGIKHKKAALDKKRGKIFSKLAKELTVAAREGGGDEEVNSRLRQAVQKAKDANVPSDNIERAIKRGTGELPGVNYETVIYEGYSVSGVAILVEAVTDNKNRTSSEIRKIFSRYKGNLAGSGSVSWQFDKKGVMLIKSSQIEEDQLMQIVLEAGAEDMITESNYYQIITDPKNYEQVRKAIEQKDIKITSAEITMEPKSYVKVADSEMADKILELVDALDDHDDVQNVYANFDIPDEILQKHT
jgi:YebC/PmpR family DNA-binding regulatory protein